MDPTGATWTAVALAAITVLGTILAMIRDKRKQADEAAETDKAIAKQRRKEEYVREQDLMDALKHRDRSAVNRALTERLPDDYEPRD